MSGSAIDQIAEPLRERNAIDAQIAALIGRPMTAGHLGEWITSQPHAVADLLGLLPRASGLYAWWAHPDVLPHLLGPAHPHVDRLRLLYVGIAANLRTRITQNHLRRSGSSTLRRTLAGLLMADESYRTRWTSRVVLIDEDELRLTSWMHDHLSVSWHEHPAPREDEPEIIGRLRPPLNVDYASGPMRDLVTTARSAYYASAGP